MLFHTWHFLFFFIIVYTVYLFLKNSRFYLHWLLIASYFFYGWWNPLYLILIFVCTLANYYAVLMLSRSRKRKKMWFLAGIVPSLGILVFFKYARFLSNNLNALFDIINIPLTVPAPGILLPVGISFFTFQAMSYTIDYYRGNVEKEPSFLKFAAFVSLFPQLVAGPIERSSNLLPQFTEKRPPISASDVSDGMSLFFVGLFKKLALADYLALYVDQVYAAPFFYDGFTLLMATFAFAWQIYFDFSGYTDMARGLAKMIGFNLMLNFNNPYLASSLGDFWNRWHISLSTWFKDYVYIPLGGNRKGNLLTYRNIFITMVISGLWHGAAWTFIAWGALHALGRFLTREIERTDWYVKKVPLLAKQLGVFCFVSFTWIYFRAETLQDANFIVRKIFTTAWQNPNFPVIMLFFTLAIWIYQFIFESKLKTVLQWSPVKVSIVIMLLFYLIIFNTSNNEAFIYFQF